MGKSIARIILVAVAAMCLALAPATQPGGGTPEEVFRDHGLTWMGFWLILPDEVGIRGDIQALRTAKGRIGVDAAARANIELAITRGRQALDAMETRYNQLNDEVAASDAKGKKLNSNSVTQYNNWVFANNELRGQRDALFLAIDKQRAALDELAKREAAVGESRSTYINLAMDAGGKAEAAAAAYAALARDAGLAAAIEQYNQTASPRARLGPSGLFAGDLEFARQCAKDVVTGPVPVMTDQGGDPSVQAVLNGKVSAAMIWDSGAAIVTLNSETGKALGLKVTSDNPTVKMVGAGGHEFQAKLVMLDSIQLGGFIVKNVQCALLPPQAKDADNLLGDTFQRCFVCRLDQQAGKLELTPVDPGVLQGPQIAAPAAAGREGTP